jgi:hypothetical protein
MGDIKGHNCWPIQHGTVYEAVNWTSPLELTWPGTDFRTKLRQTRYFIWLPSCKKSEDSLCQYSQADGCFSLRNQSPSNLHFLLRWTSHGAGIADSLRAGRAGDRIPVKARFSAPVQTGLGAHWIPYSTGTGSFSGGKSARAWLWPPTPSSAEIKERVKLYLCSPTGPSWPDLGWPLPLLNVIYIASELFFSMLDHFVRFPKTFL